MYVSSSNLRNINGKFHSHFTDEESHTLTSSSLQNWAAFLREGVVAPVFTLCCGLIGHWLPIQSSSRATPSLVVSPALPSVAADGIFIVVDTDLGFSRAVPSVCPPSGHWRFFPAHTIQGHIPCTAQRPLVWAYMCALAQASTPLAPRGLWHQRVCQNAPRERGWCGCPCCLSTNLPVQCSGAWSLAAPSVCPEWQCPSCTGPLSLTFCPLLLDTCCLSLSLVPKELNLMATPRRQKTTIT